MDKTTGLKPDPEGIDPPNGKGLHKEVVTQRSVGQRFFKGLDVAKRYLRNGFDKRHFYAILIGRSREASGDF